MAKKRRAKKAKPAPTPTPTPTSIRKSNVDGIDESALTKGEMCKLNALRKSVGDTLGEATFTKWLEKKAKQSDANHTDKNADMIANTIMGLIESKGIRLPRGGYLITRGRGRVIVEAAK